MNNLFVTKDFKTFVNGCSVENYQEVYDLHQAAIGKITGQTTYIIEECIGSEDILIIHEPTCNAIRLTPKAREYFPRWIEENLMKSMDAETYWGIEYAISKSEFE